MKNYKYKCKLRDFAAFPFAMIGMIFIAISVQIGSAFTASKLPAYSISDIENK
jgi:hypothetical protein